MAIFSGKLGKVVYSASDLTDITHWTLNIQSNNAQHGGSAEPGHKVSVGGVKSATISIEGKVDASDAIYDRLKPGDQVTLELYERFVIAAHADNRMWSIPARIESFEVDVDIDEGEAVSFTMEATSHGAWTYPDGTLSA